MPDAKTARDDFLDRYAGKIVLVRKPGGKKYFYEVAPITEQPDVPAIVVARTGVPMPLVKDYGRSGIWWGNNIAVPGLLDRDAAGDVCVFAEDATAFRANDQTRLFNEPQRAGTVLTPEMVAAFNAFRPNVGRDANRGVSHD